MKALYCLVFFLLAAFSSAQLTKKQQKTVDSLKQVIKTSKNDTLIVQAFVLWDDIIYVSNTALDLELNKKINSLCDKKLKKNLSTQEKRFYQKAKGPALNNIGNIYLNQGNYNLAISYYTQRLQLSEKLNDKLGISISLNNIGMIYLNQKEYDKAASYFTKNIPVFTEINDYLGVVASLNNLGLIYHNLGQDKKGLEYCLEGLALAEQKQSDMAIAVCLTNLGIIYQSLGQHTQAINSYTRCLSIRENLKDNLGVAASLNCISTIFIAQKNYTNALPLSCKALAFAKKENYTIEVKKAAFNLYTIYKRMAQYQEAVEMHELYLSATDSLEREENHKEVIRQEYKYQYEKQTLADSIKHAEAQKLKDARLAQQKAQAQRQEARLKNQRILQYALFGGLFLLLIFTGFVYNRFRVIRTQKLIIEEKEKVAQQQKEVIEEKQKEIIDSINYARRIQFALLPQAKYIARELKKLIQE